ncbi:unnamed protein product, partial [marine sediment metagenome]
IEDREWGQGRVFYTSSLEYASVYAMRAADFTDSVGIVLKVEIPVHLIAEIKEAIFNPTSDMMNETSIFDEFKDIMNQNLSEENLEKIIEHKIFNSNNQNEFSTYMILPAKYIVGVEPITLPREKTREEFLEIYRDMILKDPISYEMIPQEFRIEEFTNIYNKHMQMESTNELV